MPIKSISVSLRFSELAKEQDISWSEAARIGMSILLSERGIDVYNNELNERRRKEFLEKKIEMLKDKQGYYYIPETIKEEDKK